MTTAHFQDFANMIRHAARTEREKRFWANEIAAVCKRWHPLTFDSMQFMKDAGLED